MNSFCNELQNRAGTKIYLYMIRHNKLFFNYPCITETMELNRTFVILSRS